MLNGGGGLNPDGLSLDLQFAADKTLTARKGPTPVFTRASTATFVGSDGLIQTAAVNAARFDHDPVTLASRGLLIEEGRTNLFTQSADFNSTDWAKVGCSISQNTLLTLSPSGQNDADQIIETLAFMPHQLNSSVTPTSATHTVSVFAKMNGRRWIALRASGVDTFFDLQNGTVVNTSQNPTITSFGNGWYRCTVQSTSATQTFFRMSVDGTTVSYLGDGASGVFIWGAQLEAGSFATSYIPTTTGSVVRSADACSITGANFTSFYNSTSGTLLSEASISNLISSNRGIVQIDNGTNGSFLRHVYSFAEGGFTSIIRAGADTPTVLSIILGTASTIQKRIIAYEGTSFASVTNGGAVATATRTMPTGLNAMKIGNLAESPFYLSGHIAAIRFYKKRLPNAKIQALTV